MTNSRLRAGLVVALMVASFAVAAAWRPSARLADQHPKIELETVFPKQFGDWIADDRMQVQLVSPDTAALLSKIYNQTLSRAYVNPTGQRIMLSVAYGGDQSDATRAHRPEVCYPAQGFQVVSSDLGRLQIGQGSIPVRRLVARQGGRNEPITYWISVGDKITVTGTDQKLAQLSYSLKGVIPDGMLVRVSSIDANEKQAFALQESFIAQMSAALQPAIRPQVIGAGI
jgi:EpsI family protein